MGSSNILSQSTLKWILRWTCNYSNDPKEKQRQDKGGGGCLLSRLETNFLWVNRSLLCNTNYEILNKSYNIYILY